MERLDDSMFLLYIEPKKEDKSVNPVNDLLTQILEEKFKAAKKGSANYSELGEAEKFMDGGWRGFHTTDSGVNSDNHDYLLSNGMITNSLCVYYLKYYRNSIPRSEIDKVKDLCLN